MPGRPEGGLERRVDVIFLIRRSGEAITLYFARQYGLAIEQLQKVAELDPNFYVAYWGLPPRAPVLRPYRPIRERSRWRVSLDRPPPVWEGYARASNAPCPGVDGIVSKRVNVAVVPARDGSVETAEQQPAPGGYQRIASVSELEPYGQFSKWVGDHDVLVFRHNGEIKALSNICPHFGGPVGYHQMKDGVFTCLWHNYRFEGASGRCLNNAHLCLRAYKVKVEDGGIWVQLVESREP